MAHRVMLVYIGSQTVSMKFEAGERTRMLKISWLEVVRLMKIFLVISIFIFEQGVENQCIDQQSTNRPNTVSKNDEDNN